MKTEHAASHSLDIPLAGSAVPDWVQVLPAGRFQGRDGRGPYTADPARVAAATLAFLAGADLPFDYEHQTERAAENGKPAPASGWGKEFAAREDGLWVRVEWTENARAALAAREYRYLSPVFYHSQAGEILRIESVALTNLPNLGLKALSRPCLASPENAVSGLRLKLPALAGEGRQDGGHALSCAEGDGFEPGAASPGKETSPTASAPTGRRGRASSEKERSDMTLAELLQQLFGLPAMADEAAIAAHARQILADAETAKAAQTTAKAELDALRAGIGKALNVQGDDAALLKAAEASVTAGTPDPAKFVPIEAHTATVAELAALKAAQAQGKADALVDAAKKAGKISPAMEAWAKDYASQNPQGFADYVAKAPVIAAAGESPAAHAGQGGPGGQTALGAVEKAVCAALGLTADDFAKARQANAAGM